jgi:hypothetical protein
MGLLLGNMGIFGFLCEQTIYISRCAVDHRLRLSSHELQNLLSHGQPTPCSVILMYTKLLSDHYQIPYLNTDFILRLKQHGWNDVKRYFSTNVRQTRSRTLTRPNMQGESTIMIPSFINDSHWIALVRREINHIVTFLYADDMNNHDTEREIKHLITSRTNELFCPPDSKWIACKNTYYMPHSNECGPRALLALHIMATDPNPNEDMLIHLMHPNIAQIARTWIAVSLSSCKLHDWNLLAHPNQYNDTKQFSYTDNSDPRDLIQWTTAPQTRNTMDLNVHSITNSNESEYNLTSAQYSSHNKTTPGNPITASNTNP